LRARPHNPAAATSTTLHNRSEDVSGILRLYSSTGDMLAISLVYCVNPQSKDPRFHLIWTFGDFLDLVPRYMGTSPTLDSAVDVLVSSYSRFCSYRRIEMDRQSLTKYTTALGALRNALASPTEASDPRTLCAIMILMIVEV
jgi:hypothetical protein